MHAQVPAAPGPSEESSKADDDDCCVVCLENVREVMFLNCGHMVYSFLYTSKYYLCMPFQGLLGHHIQVRFASA